MDNDQKEKRQKRTLKFIADFENGYASGWYFAVNECFKDQLDIKYTTRIEKKKTYMCWTQGRFFSFAEGHIIYDKPCGDIQWNEALKVLNVACFVVTATPDMINEKKKFVKGHVHFELLKPNLDRTRLESVDSYHATQKEFVEFLKTGIFKDKTVEQLLSTPMLESTNKIK